MQSEAPGPASQDANGSPPNLHCCQGQPPPDGVEQGWKALLAMPTAAQQAFVELLTRALVDLDDTRLEEALAAFCNAHGVQRDPALAALHASRFLLQRAAALDLDAQRFVEDLQALSPSDDAGGVRVMGARYLPLKSHIREGLLEQSLADHGKVLVGLDWRVDRVSSSDRAVDLDTPVVFLTLQLQDAGERERVTVQLTNRSVQLLRQFCQRFSDSGDAEAPEA